MTTTKKLKIWTLITHGLILVGAGHGILFLFIIEIFTFPYLTKDSFIFSFNGVDNHFAVIGFLSLLGQICLLFSLFNLKQNLKNVFQIVGLILFWLSIAYFIYDTTKDSYTHIALVTVIPFAVCTIITFLGQSVRRLYNRIID
ncbi:hypothetical protein ESA94_02790 [Lacibacter luteus]|uniref:Uncharacterized protein n=1 Tax=Lacibacter luteus TaxID=2508719 RepID=A0A4Q1CLQ5_9BACT|nr:hypothetical protein [Lacibacter luteus]RXK61957.1 hypothetical protein ESA94_02790 [Lacibacter luteus]